MDSSFTLLNVDATVKRYLLWHKSALLPWHCVSIVAHHGLCQTDKTNSSITCHKSVQQYAWVFKQDQGKAHWCILPEHFIIDERKHSVLCVMLFKVDSLVWQWCRLCPRTTRKDFEMRIVQRPVHLSIGQIRHCTLASLQDQVKTGWLQVWQCLFSSLVGSVFSFPSTFSSGLLYSK